MEQTYPEIINHDSFNQMYKLQMVLIDHYVKIEGLPKPPVDLNTRAGQKVIRDFSNRIIEELSEAYEDLLLALKYISQNSLDEAKIHIGRFNVEIADVMHFILELIIFSGLTEKDFDELILEGLNEMNIEGIYTENAPIETLLNLGRFENKYLEKTPLKFQFHFYKRLEVLEDPRKLGCYVLAPQDLFKHNNFLWSITHSFNQLNNLLKSKDWVKNEKEVNGIEYYHRLASAITEVFAYLEFCNMSELCIFYNYVDKNRINLERIKNGY